MLELDSDKRITAEQALSHRYLTAYSDPNDEPVSAPYDQSIEDMNLPVENWKGKKSTCVRLLEGEAMHVDSMRYQFDKKIGTVY